MARTQGAGNGSAMTATEDAARRRFAAAQARPESVAVTTRGTVLIGAHVSTGGGLTNALERGEDRRCEAIQIFNQSPRMWRPTRYSGEDFTAFREAFEPSPIEAIVIHMIYLINPATADREMRQKSLASLVHALTVGEGIGAIGVVVHPGALKTDTRSNARKRAVKLLKEALAETESCSIIYENTAGSKQLLGLDFDETSELIEATGGGKRLGLCIDSCHLHATGYDVRTPQGTAEIVDEIEAKMGLERLRCLHLNDSKDERGSNRDRHESIGKGRIGRKGFRAFLGEPRFEGLPALLETPGPAGRGPDRKEVQTTKRLYREGVKAR
jgi:deoxyribonuclease-4